MSESALSQRLRESRGKGGHSPQTQERIKAFGSSVESTDQRGLLTLDQLKELYNGSKEQKQECFEALVRKQNTGVSLESEERRMFIELGLDSQLDKTSGQVRSSH